MITTDRDKISLWWLLLLSIPVAAFAFVEKCSGTALTFTMRKFIADPALIVFLGSINKLFGIIIAPWIAFKSDTIHTFLGRRKSFIIIGFLLLFLSLILVPYASNIVFLIAVIVVYQFAVDFGYTGPWMPLYFDIVPKPQRGRGMVINRYLSIAARFIFMYFLIGNFDMHVGPRRLINGMTSYRFAGLTGEKVIYFSAALLVLISLLIVWLFIKEDKSSQRQQRHYKFTEYLRVMFTERNNFYMCLLVICSVLMSTQLMNLRPLLITEQFGYPKKIMGNINVVNMIVDTTLILPIIIIFIDRVNRFKIFAVGMLLSTLHPIVYWCYVKFLTVNGIPSVSAIIVFNIMDSIFDKTAMLVLWPFLFDIIDPAKKGFMNSGFLIVIGIVGFLNANLMGLWVKAYSSIFTTYTDYMSSYLYIFIVGIFGCIGTYLFSRTLPA